MNRTLNNAGRTANTAIHLLRCIRRESIAFTPIPGRAEPCGQAGSPRSPDPFADPLQDVVQRITVTIQVKHRGESR